MKREKWINECHAKFSTFISSSQLYEECPDNYDIYLSKKIYDYWINKREMNQTMPLIKHIDFVLEQRENAELLITQITNCLKIRQEMLQVNFIDSKRTGTHKITNRSTDFFKNFPSRNDI